MASKKISELTAKTPVSTDLVPIADPSTGVAYKSNCQGVVFAGISQLGIAQVNGSMAYASGNVTLTANTNNLFASSNTIFRITSTGNYDLTGIIPLPNTTEGAGRLIYLINVGSNNVTLKNEDALSTAQNRFVTHGGSHITLSPGHLVLAIYDSTLLRWRIWDLT